MSLTVAPFGHPGPPEWAEAIFGYAWWYRWSSFSYCGAGAMLVLRPEPMYRHAQPCCAAFPFRTMGGAIVLNGLLSYMGDTHTWGRPSCWKSADVLFATANTALQFVLVLLHLLGPMTFPRDKGRPEQVAPRHIDGAVMCEAAAAHSCVARLRWRAPVAL